MIVPSCACAAVVESDDSSVPEIWEGIEHKIRRK